MTYTLDKLVVYLRVKSAAVDRIIHVWNSGSDALCSVQKFWIGHSPSCVRRTTHCRRAPAIRSLWVLAFMARLLLLTGKL